MSQSGKTQTGTKDLTDGSPLKLILSFMLPLLLGMLFQQFYNMVDTVIVGQTLGVEALAGVGSTGSITFLVLGLCNGICAGFAIPVAQCFGRRSFGAVRKFVCNMAVLTVAFAAVLTALTCCGCRQILVWMRTPDNTFQYAYDYLFLIFLGIPATMLYNLLSGILRSLGDSRTPVVFLILSSLLNIALDIWFIRGFGMGTAGAGLATLVSQLVSGILCLMYIAKHFPILYMEAADWKLEPRYMGLLLSMGLPMGLQYSITAIGSILLQSSVNTLGSTAMAAMTAGGKVGNFATCVYDALGSTCATFAGQNIGAGKPERIREGVRDAGVIGCAYSVVALLVLNACADNFLALFLSDDDTASAAQILPLGKSYLVRCACFYIPLLYVNVLRFTIQGLGYSRLAVVAGVLEMIARGVFALCFVPSLGFDAVCFASPAAWIMADLFLLPAYIRCMKKQGCRMTLPRLIPARAKN